MEELPSDSNNRQYIDQIFRYEDGSLILAQGNRSVTRQRPLFTIMNNKPDKMKNINNYSVSIELMNVSGEPDSIASDTDTSIRLAALNSTKLYDSDDSESIDSFNFTVFTDYPDAWYSFFNETAKNAGLYNKIDYTLEKKVANNSNDLSSVSFNFIHGNGKNLEHIYINKSVISAELEIGISST